MSSLPHQNDSNGQYATLTNTIECAVDNMHALTLRMETAGFGPEAERLRGILAAADDHLSNVYRLDGVPTGDVRRRFDLAVGVLAKCHKLLYTMVESKCQFGEHYELLKEIRSVTSEFQQRAHAKLSALKIDYYEFKSLELEVEAKLGTDLEIPDDSPHERRRRMPKDPVKIEAALRTCIETAEALRPKIISTDRQDKLDQLLDKARSRIAHLPEGTDEMSYGKRVGKLLSSAAIIMKVSKWIRQVDLLETESGSSRDRILHQFDVLAALATGQELRNGRT